MKKSLILLFIITIFSIGCSSKVETYDSSAIKAKAQKAYKDLNNELKSR